MAKKSATGGSKGDAVRQYLAEHPQASPRQVAAELREQGIEVSESLAKQIKYGQRPVIRQMQKVARKKAPAKRNLRRLQKGISRSQAIRSYLADHPTAETTEVVDALGEQGIGVSANLVRQVKHSDQPGRKRSPRRNVPPWQVAMASVTAAALTAADLIEAKRLADQLGGIEQAKKALKMLEQLVE